MTRPSRWLTPVAVVALVVFPGCRSTESKAKEAAENTSQLAASSRQKQLWQDAADNANAPGLDRVPVDQEPVDRRQRPPAGRSTPVPPQPITIPDGVVSIRIVDFPLNPAQPHQGPANVLKADNGTIQLDLGAKRFLTVVARVGKNDLVKAGQTVDVVYDSRRGPRDQRTVIGIRHPKGGPGIVQVAESRSDKPVTIDVPLFNITLQQSGTTPGSPVLISGLGLTPDKLQSGETRQFGDITVFIVGSAGVGKGADVAQIEGNPYALNVMVWKVP